MAKLNIDYVKSECLKRNIEFIDDTYFNNNFKHNFKCLIHNKICKSKVRNVISCNNKLACCGCGARKHSIEYIKLECLKRGFELVSGTYSGINVKHDFRCLKHYEIHSAQPRQILLGSNGLKCCGSEKLRGSNNYNWNPNLSDEERNHRRNGYLSSQWAAAVRVRDEYTCQVCNKNNLISPYCISHHIESYNHNENLRYDINNGACLCRECHSNFHKKYGYGKNTRDQFEKFKLG